MHGIRLRKQARQLLQQLSGNRPRRALDLDATAWLLRSIAEATDVDKTIEDLVQAAWEWGVSCEVDDVRWGQDGDSHNQMLRDRTYEIATRLLAELLSKDQADRTEVPASVK